MYIAGNEITVTWVLGPTDSPQLSTDYDIDFVLSPLTGSYTDDGIINYVAPTAITAGSLQYQFTPEAVGRYRLALGIGTGLAYTVLDHKDFWIFSESPTSAASTKVLAASARAGVALFHDPISSYGWNIGRIDGAGYDGDDLILFGVVDTLVEKLYYTDSKLSTPTFAFNIADLTGWVAPTVSNGDYVNQIEYSPTLGIWVMALAYDQMYSCTGDPTVVGNWTLAATPGEWTGGTYTNIERVIWVPQLLLFFMFTDTNIGQHQCQVSNDGTNWQAWEDYQTLALPEPDLCYGWLSTTFNGGPFHMFAQYETYLFKENNTDAGSFPGAADSFTQTENNGVIGGSGTRILHHLATDGTAVVCSTNGYMNASLDPTDHPGLFTANSWGPDGRPNTGWSDTVMGFAASSSVRQVLLYIEKLARPWVIFNRGPSGNGADYGWFDAESIVAPGSGARNSGNAPSWAECTVEPFASMNTLYTASLWNIPVTNGPMGTYIGQYHMRYDANSVYGLNGYLMVMSGSGTSTRDEDYLVFQKPS